MGEIDGGSIFRTSYCAFRVFALCQLSVDTGTVVWPNADDFAPSSWHEQFTWPPNRILRADRARSTTAQFMDIAEARCSGALMQLSLHRK